MHLIPILCLAGLLPIPTMGQTVSNGPLTNPPSAGITITPTVNSPTSITIPTTSFGTESTTTATRPVDSASSQSTTFPSSSSTTSTRPPDPSSLVSNTPSSTLSGEASSGIPQPLPTGIPPSKKHNLMGAIVGGVLGGLTLFILVSILCYRRRSRRGAVAVLVPLNYDPAYTQPSGRNEKPAQAPVAISHPSHDAEVGSPFSNRISRAPSIIRKGPSAERDVEAESLSQRIVALDILKRQLEDQLHERNAPPDYASQRSLH
ncbi:hypothetical protein FPV67DRAFT_661892 [Lyophyllum atratum]|nr:hypothetical protein FPV67DRAFT_661892 [Lyophyllum atratum]